MQCHNPYYTGSHSIRGTAVCRTARTVVWEGAKIALPDHFDVSVPKMESAAETLFGNAPTTRTDGRKCLNDQAKGEHNLEKRDEGPDAGESNEINSRICGSNAAWSAVSAVLQYGGRHSSREMAWRQFAGSRWGHRLDQLYDHRLLYRRVQRVRHTGVTTLWGTR